MDAIQRQIFLSADAGAVAALFAVDPAGLGGVALRCAAGPARDEWLALLRALLPERTPLRRIPLHVNDTGLLGGLDLALSLQAGRPVVRPGVLAQADGGVVVLAMAERASPGTAARLAGVLDTQQVAIERDGLATRLPARLGLVAFDEGASDAERMPSALLDRLAFHLVLDGSSAGPEPVRWQRSDIAQARARLGRIEVPDAVLQALCGAALALGVDSSRASLLALRVARAAAALAGAPEVGDEHAALAARLVLAPRATRLPAVQAPAEPDEDEAQAEPSPLPTDAHPSDGSTAEPGPLQTDPAPQPVPDPVSAPAQADSDTMPRGRSGDDGLAETVLQAALASLPAGLLAALQTGAVGPDRSAAAGRSGAGQKGLARGRPIGARRGEPRAGARLDVIETLRAAAPWQRLRRQQELKQEQEQETGQQRNPPRAGSNLAASPGPATRGRIQVRREDFHITRFRQLGRSTTLFVVDASGSSALHRLAEAKGAVELLLADCYVRRDRVAVLAFRGQAAELLLPPTRSLARAKRSLAALPGGGGTPLAAGLDSARALAEAIRRHGETPIVVLLTDGRANIARDGTPGRLKAAQESTAAAQQIRRGGFTALLLDTSPQPQPIAQQLAQDMGATYLALPYAGARRLSQAVREALVPGARPS